MLIQIKLPKQMWHQWTDSVQLQVKQPLLISLQNYVPALSKKKNLFGTTDLVLIMKMIQPVPQGGLFAE